MSIGTSQTSLGNAIPTQNVAHSVRGLQKLKMKYTAGAAGLTKVPLFCKRSGLAAYANIGNPGQQGKQGTLEVTGFATIEEFVRMSEKSDFSINGCKVFSTDTGNLDLEVIHEEKIITGKEDSITEDFSDNKVPLGTGWGQEMKIAANKLVWRPDANWDIYFASLAAGTSITFEFYVTGIVRGFSASPMVAKVVGQ